MKFNNILVCTDFSPSSDRALRLAGKILTERDATIHVLHVAPVEYYLGIGREVIPELLHVGLMEKLQEQEKRCKVSAKSEVLFAQSVVAGILNSSIDKKIDLIVIGDKSGTGLSKFFVGSLASRLASAAKVPVLVVKTEASPEHIGILAENTSELTTFLPVTQEWSSRFHSRLSVFSIIPDYTHLYTSYSGEYSSAVMNALKEITESSLKSFQQRLKEQLSPETEVFVELNRGREVSYSLLDLLKEKMPDLVVLKKSQKTTVSRYILGSVSMRMLEFFEGNLLFV